MAQPQGRLPITDGIMLVIFKSLSSTYDHIIFWAACTLAYFGFLRLGEFMVPSLECFSADLHLVLDDIAVDSQSSPFCMRVRIKVTKAWRYGSVVVCGRVAIATTCPGPGMLHFRPGNFKAPTLHALQLAMSLIIN